MELEGRIVMWTLALIVEYTSPAFRYNVPLIGKSHDETLHVSGAHMAERCALFVIICLGETILTTGRNAAEHMADDMTFVVFCSAFLSTGFMWWIYFHHGQEKAASKAEATSRPETLALNLFTYGHLPVVAGIILTAVGEDFSLSHAEEPSSLTHASPCSAARPSSSVETSGSRPWQPGSSPSRISLGSRFSPPRSSLCLLPPTTSYRPWRLRCCSSWPCGNTWPCVVLQLRPPEARGPR
ncbi:low temperature requirement protein A [Ensifer adhaerens]|uniref:low temperature requirement protein A n=1 Tax=Ensifer adhaerens TaxID=106592 RepID=UPI001F22E29F|nr:low temperature requirement protein A [Ensifer adhaerens]